MNYVGSFDKIRKVPTPLNSGLIDSFSTIINASPQFAL